MCVCVFVFVYKNLCVYVLCGMQVHHDHYMYSRIRKCEWKRERERKKEREGGRERQREVEEKRKEEKEREDDDGGGGEKEGETQREREGGEGAFIKNDLAKLGCYRALDKHKKHTTTTPQKTPNKQVNKGCWKNSHFVFRATFHTQTHHSGLMKSLESHQMKKIYEPHQLWILGT